MPSFSLFATSANQRRLPTGYAYGERKQILPVQQPGRRLRIRSGGFCSRMEGSK
jgi:hypothetical protein